MPEDLKDTPERSAPASSPPGASIPPIEEAAGGTGAEPEATQSPRGFFREYGRIVIYALFIALVLKVFFIEAFGIPTPSMRETLLVGDYLFVNKFVYGLRSPRAIPLTGIRIPHMQLLPGFSSPQRGDIVVFEFPEDRDKSFWQRRDFIKRVIGLPGDTVEVREKKVFVNGQLLVIPEAVYKDGTVLPGGRDNMPAVKVPAGHYFMMGDNRDRSYDSRFWGFVSNAEIKGLAFIKYWSVDNEHFQPRWGRIGRLID